MEPIRVTIGKRWREKDQQLAKRLTDIVVGSHCQGPHWLSQSSKWQLDDGNNWWMRVDGDEAVIDYRDKEAMTHEQWAALKCMIGWVLGDK